jgi:hypothetical protein
MAQPRWDIPLPTYNRDVNELVRIYKNAILEVIAILESLSTRGSEKDISRAQMNTVLAQLAVLIGQVDKDAEAWVKEQIKEAFINGQVEALVTIGEAKTLDEARSMISGAAMSALVMESIDALTADTFEDLLFANNKMKQSTIKMVRAVVAEQMKAKAAAGMGRNTSRKAIVAALNKKDIRDRFNVEGNVAIVDRAGRRWKLETYAEMVTRTKMLQAHTEGTRVEALERGVDLAIISSHNADDSCRKFEGQIISLNGHTEGFMTYDGLRRSNLIFHPNCRHKVTPIRDINLLPEAVRKKFEEGQKEAKAALRAAKKKK